MMIPPAVFSSAGAGFTITRSDKGVTLNFLPIVVFDLLFYEITLSEMTGRQSYTNFVPNPPKMPFFQADRRQIGPPLISDLWSNRVPRFILIFAALKPRERQTKAL
jgi:hypothetical protein